MYKAVIYCISVLVCATNAFAQNVHVERKLNALLSKQFEPSQPGCAVIVAKRDTVIYKKAFGIANLELNVPMKADMLFNIASITKQYTAVAILQLAEQGKLSLQDSVQKFVPDYPSKGHSITIEHLLTHTSGIKDYLQLDYVGTNMERWDFSPKQLIDSFKNYPLNFEPGTKYAYSNSGYYLLGYIIEKITGKRYQTYMEDAVFKPLGLEHTCFDSSWMIVPNRVSGYSREGATFRNTEYWSPSIEYAAGGIISNIDDLYKWHTGLYKYQVLKKESLQKAFTPYQLKDGSFTNYGYGWTVKNANGIRSIGHQGGLPGFVTNEVYFPDEDVFIAVLCNSRNIPVENLTIDIAGIALGRSLQENIKVDEKTLDSYVGIYQLSIDANRKLAVSKTEGQLIATFSPSQIFPLLFSSKTKFQFKNLLDVNCEFIQENGKIIKIALEQNGHYEWIKIQ